MCTVREKSNDYRNRSVKYINIIDKPGTSVSTDSEGNVQKECDSILHKTKVNQVNSENTRDFSLNYRLRNTMLSVNS